MGAYFQSSQYSDGKVLSTGKDIPFVLERYKRPGPGILDELMLRDEFDAAKAAAEEATKKLLAEDQPVEKRPVTYLALGIMVVGGYLAFRRRPAVKLGSTVVPDILPKGE
jgi:hypothetical protein